MTSYKDATTVAICGIEGHICVQQTVLDILEKGDGKDRVVVITDAVSSMHALDRDVAFERMRDAGAELTTAESFLYDLCGDSDDAKSGGGEGEDIFRSLVRATKEHARDTRA